MATGFGRTRQLGAFVRMLRVFVVRDLREQYAGTLLGGVWAVLQPLLLVAIYWWVFGFVWALKVPVLGERATEVPFVVFLLSGLLPWLAFQEAVNKSATAVLSRADVLRHGSFPVEVFPAARVLAAHLVYFGLIAVFALVSTGGGVLAAPHLLLGLGVLYLVQLGFACGVAMLVSALAVYVRDLPHLLSMLLMGVFFTAPVLYPLSQIPEAMRAWVWLNPFTPFALGYHAVLLEGRLPDAAVCAYVVALAVFAGGVGVFVFRRLRPGFADVV
ncbi:MAG: ABC transporter permease [Rhodocyclaceae bacterium]